MVTMLVRVTGLGALLAVGSAAPTAQDPQPPLKSGVELVLVDAQVVDRTGAPIAGLTADRFEVKVGGKRRKVASLEFLAGRVLPAAVASAASPSSFVASEQPYR